MKILAEKLPSVMFLKENAMWFQVFTPREAMESAPMSGFVSLVTLSVTRL